MAIHCGFVPLKIVIFHSYVGLPEGKYLVCIASSCWSRILVGACHSKHRFTQILWFDICTQSCMIAVLPAPQIAFSMVHSWLFSRACFCPQIAKLLGLFLSLWAKLHVCVLELDCWCRCTCNENWWCYHENGWFYCEHLWFYHGKLLI